MPTFNLITRREESMKKVFNLILCFLIFLFLYPGISYAESNTVQKADIRAIIQDNGDLYVEELYSYRLIDESLAPRKRPIREEDYKLIASFEAYRVPLEVEIDTIQHSDLEPLNIRKHGRSSYLVDITPSTGEQKILFRYTLKNYVHKYRDTGHLYWRFADSRSDNNLQNVRIRIYFEDQKALNGKHYSFLHDLTGGVLTQHSNIITYENSLLPAGNSVQIHYLFPPSYLEKAPIKKDHSMLPVLLTNQEQYQKQFENRELYFSIIEKINRTLVILFSALLLFAIFYPRRLYRLFKTGIPPNELEKGDSFLIAVLNRKGDIIHSDIVSALFRMHQKGSLSLEKKESKAAYLEDIEAPKSTFLFTLMKPEHTLRDFEKKLIDWLFRRSEDGILYFSIDDLPFPTVTEKRANWKLEDTYKVKARTFHKQYKLWKKAVLRDPAINEYIRPNLLRGFLLKWVTPLWIIWSLINVYLGMGEGKLMPFALPFYFLGWLYVLLICKKQLAYPVYLLIFSISLNLFTFEWTDLFLTLTILNILIGLFLPVTDMTRKGAELYKGLKSFKKSFHLPFELSHGEMELERFLQHAIALDLYTTIQNKHNQLSSSNQSLPLLESPIETAEIFYYLNRQFDLTYSHGKKYSLNNKNSHTVS